nr:PLP-dependent aminotransferase family protein [uncultured Chryseobacterium sp.]
MQKYKYEIFTSVIKEQIESRVFNLGERLPSVREIKKKYALSTSSVQRGYDDLVIQGYVENRSRSGYFVLFKKNDSIPENISKFPFIIRDSDFDRKVMLTSDMDGGSEHALFSAAAPGDLMIPQKLILRKMQEVIREKLTAILRYYPSNGSEQLKTRIVSRTSRLGSRMDAEQLVITDGALQALYIALSSVTEAGDIVAVESPCVFSVLEVISNLKLKIVEIPVHYKDGFDIDYLKEAINKHMICAVLITPNFHNPTGILLSDKSKKEIASIAKDYKIPVIENDIYGDLYFGDERPSTIGSFDTQGWVLTYSSFSKTLAPGIRLGWLCAGRFSEKAERIKFSLGRSVSPLYQELMIKILEGNTYDRHLRTVRRQLEIQASEFLDLLKISFPKGSYFHKPYGGYSIWGRLPDNIKMSDFYTYCESQKIIFTPGDTFSFTDIYSHCFRIIFADKVSAVNFLAIRKAGAKAMALFV